MPTNKSKEFEGKLYRYTFTNLFKAEKPDNNNDGWVYAIIALLVFYGAEAVKIIFRSDFGREGIIIWRSILCSLSFIIFAVYFFYNSNNSESYQVTTEGIIISLGYILLAIALFIKTLNEWKKAARSNTPPDYEGNSTLLRFFVEAGQEQKTVQSVVEPVVTIIVGGAIWIFSPIGSLPIIFCGASVWGTMLIKVIFRPTDLNDKKEELKAKNKSQRVFHKVKTNQL